MCWLQASRLRKQGGRHEASFSANRHGAASVIPHLPDPSPGGATRKAREYPSLLCNGSGGERGGGADRTRRAKLYPRHHSVDVEGLVRIRTGARVRNQTNVLSTTPNAVFDTLQGMGDLLGYARGYRTLDRRPPVSAIKQKAHRRPLGRRFGRSSTTSSTTSDPATPRLVAPRPHRPDPAPSDRHRHRPIGPPGGLSQLDRGD